MLHHFQTKVGHIYFSRPFAPCIFEPSLITTDMFVLILLISLTLLIIGKYEFHILRLDTDLRKQILTVGKLGLGIAFGVLLYTESTDLLRGFRNGFYGK